MTFLVPNLPRDGQTNVTLQMFVLSLQSNPQPFARQAHSVVFAPKGSAELKIYKLNYSFYIIFNMEVCCVLNTKLLRLLTTKHESFHRYLMSLSRHDSSILQKHYPPLWIQSGKKRNATSIKIIGQDGFWRSNSF